MPGNAVLAEIDLVEVLSGRHDGEEDIDLLELEQVGRDVGAGFGERLGFRARAVPDRDVIASREQALGHGMAHASHADPTDFFLRCHHNSPCLISHGGGPYSRSATALKRMRAVRHQISTMTTR